MPQINNIEITGDDISYAESILLKDGQTFDDERREFIKNLETIDLQAVPGSGKTTALLAKLLILEKKMPFPNGSGILVLSHTNTAVDEITEKLGKIAPKLFDFPNFIGTIQEFVNKFLAKPYGINYLGIKFQHIDTEYYESLCYIGYNGWLDRRGDKDYILQKSIKVGTELFYFNGESFPLRDNTKDLYKKILEMKSNILEKGVISYDEAYYYGSLYINKIPNIIKILQNRFKYVFIDEMQDMQKHQVDILEKLFYDEGNSISKLQRIGDTNQAIYDGIVSEDCMWKGRDEITGNPNDKLKIIGSHRFTEKISNVVKCFGLNNNDLNGKRKITDGLDDISIKPILIIYNDSHLNNTLSEPIINNNIILEKFSNIIKEKIDEGYFKDVDKITSKAIIWNAKSDTERDGTSKFELSKCRAKHYFYDYDIMGSKSKNKQWFKNEKDYLFYYDKNDRTYRSKYNNIINLFLKILSTNDIKNENGRYFNKTSLFKYLSENNEDIYLDFKGKLLNWSRDLNYSNINEISEKLDEFFPNIIILLPGNKNINLRIKDLEYTEGLNITEDNDKKINTYSNNGIEINIGTVHSVKGETHTCTLYLESSSNGYESSDKIKYKSFLGEDFGGTASYGKQAMKMLYVGLSRPTHLLCYAIHEDRFNELKAINEEKLNNLWEIKNIT
ncbi:MAG: UvrD-helicase domain-containing protein [Candidatus Gracilibacteria bacterium]|nr:UvrD-helicase domain-containing protein [Candidatus Gracilibacteria bacterium]